MIRRLLAWLDRPIFQPREPVGLGPMDVGRYEHPQRARDRVAMVLAIRESEREREMTLIRLSLRTGGGLFNL